MKASCISHPEKEPLILIRHWQIKFCQGNRCAAALLSFYEYWHNIKREMCTKAKKANDIAEVHGDKRSQDESVLQFHTLDELSEGILNLYGRTAIIEANKFLESLGVITCNSNPNPRYHFDKTRYIEFHPEICNQWLQEHNRNSSENSSKHPSPEEEKEDKSFQEVTLNYESELSKYENEPRSSKTKTELSKSENVRSKYENGRYSTEITTEISNRDIKTTAADYGEGYSQDESTKIKAAAANYNFLEPLIGKQLTEPQRQVMQKVVASLQRSCFIPNPEQLSQEIEFCLLDSKSFTQAENDFLKKLNTIQKMVRKGKWETPAGLIQVQKVGKSKEKNELLYQLGTLESDCQWYREDALSRHVDEPTRKLWENELEAKLKKIEELKKRLKALGNGVNRSKHSEQPLFCEKKSTVNSK